jgi:deazaflavin-dependent oxidoreductase (nitroreductase family)
VNQDGYAGRAAFNAKIIEEFRATGGRVSGTFAHTPLILVHHIGARSGVERVVPLAYVPHTERQFLVIASDGGSRTHPKWYYNLKANPRVTVEVDGESFRVVAEELDLEQRSLVWPRIVAQAPSAGEFQGRTARTIPVFMLTREE